MTTEAKGTVVWLTGLPSSGKSLLAARVHAALRERGVPTCTLDGDAVRGVLHPTPGYDETARLHFYATLGELAALLARQGLVVLVPATANRRAFREAARGAAPRFIEVFVDVPLETCETRDAKGLYARARSGSLAEMPGRGVAYEPPLAPDVVASGGKDAEAASRILELAA